MAVNANFDALLATTIANYRDKMTDNIFSARPLTYFLNDKSRIRMIDGGTKIVEPLIYGVNSTVGSYAGYDSIALTAQDGISAAEFEWKQFAASIAINGIEEAKKSEGGSLAVFGTFTVMAIIYLAISIATGYLGYNIITKFQI